MTVEDMAVGTPEAAALAEYNAERERQIGWRNAIRETAFNILQQDESPCMDGVNDWLRDNGVPEILDRRSLTGGQERAQAAAERAVPELENPDHYSATGIRAQLASRRRQGEQWRERVVRNLRALPEDRDDIPEHLISQLISQLTGQPEQVRDANGTRLSVTAEFVLTDPHRMIPPAATPADVTPQVRAGLTGALREMIRQSAFNVQLDGEVGVQVTITR